MTTVREAKAKLAALMEKLNTYDDSAKFDVELNYPVDDTYISDIFDFDISKGCDGTIWLTNF